MALTDNSLQSPEHLKKIHGQIREDMERRSTASEDLREIIEALEILAHPQSTSSMHIAYMRDQLEAIQRTLRVTMKDDARPVMKDGEKDPTVRHVF